MNELETYDYLNTKGRIFDIQRFSVHDGPGIRTIFFLKGCVLRCRWCCNPESQNYDIEQMNVGGKTKIVGEDVTAGYLLEIAEKDRIYYSRSGGGVTLSGGESLCQSTFASAILRGCKENGINTAIESTACAGYDKIRKVIEYLDYFLMDIKHMNSAKHKEFTGQSNELMLENARKIARENVRLTVRVPVIPGFNDTPGEISDIAEFTKSLETVEEIHLLPYHRLGFDKYVGLGRDYLMGDAPLLSSEKIYALKSAVEKHGLICKIGG